MKLFVSYSKILSLLCFLVIFSSFCKAQEIDDLPNEPYGSAGDCKGKILIVNCFISEPSNEWLSEEKEATLVKEQTGIVWLKQQAALWGVNDLSFQQCTIGLDKDVQVGKIEHSGEPAKLKIHWVTYALHAAGYSNVYKLYDSLKKEYNVDNVAVIILAKKEGRSYAQHAFEAGVKYSNEWYVEGSIVYKKYWDSGKDLCTGTIIHEMLHLFGAWDMYHSDMRDYSVQNIINNLFKNSIMLHDRNDDLRQYKIDQMTAWRLGWTKRYWPWYEMFRKEGTVKYWSKIPGAKQDED